MMPFPIWLYGAPADQAGRARGHNQWCGGGGGAARGQNARQVQQAFANGATLAEIEQHIALLRSLGAPDDAHPRVGVNDDYEVTMVICVVRRRTSQVSGAS
jgi:hypothetical protein